MMPWANSPILNPRAKLPWEWPVRRKLGLIFTSSLYLSNYCRSLPYHGAATRMKKVNLILVQAEYSEHA